MKPSATPFATVAAKSGELAEHTNRVHLVAGEEIVETVPSYRGLGMAW